MDKLEEVIKSSLNGLADIINKNMVKINSKIDEINKKQDELTDQMIFTSKGEDIPSEITPIEKDSRPFAFIGTVEIDSLYNFIQQEHPQLIALVLSYLEPGFASAMISRFDNNMQADLIKRISCMDRTSPEVLGEIERVLEKKLHHLAAYKKIYKAGGINSAAKILNVSSRKLEKNIIESLEKYNPELAQEIKKNLFIFEDIIMLDKKVLEIVISKVKRDDLLLSLKATDEKVRTSVISLVKDKEGFKKELTNLGPARLSDVEAAQYRIVDSIKHLEEEGLIEIIREDEEIVE